MEFLEHTGKSACLWICKFFFNSDIECPENKSKINEWDYINLKTSI